MSDELRSFLLRLPPEEHAALKQMAEQAEVSINAFICGLIHREGEALGLPPITPQRHRRPGGGRKKVQP